ncbi:5-formyltetrahydrofolate cyclo-ligase [Aureispira sp. CCB-QB1]|uniref:5-formyltetrahydrofolate cyclo-ligase n=1 Tax=Aureispira sp. CCB-QB1 TaxID=1313421 RepID=UPI0006991C41|nr:5-formyltetrahydrofolate cyclo-ligase [Aureispira sp. CCB-QB1]
MTIMQEKKALRAEILLKRNNIPIEKKSVYDARIVRDLMALIQARNCTNVHAYLPMGAEINIYPLIEKLLEQKTNVYCPKTLKNRKLEHLKLEALDKLEEGLWGTKHPNQKSIYEGSFDLILVPGLAFDAHGNRLGYGGGYYDNFLSQHPHAYKVALAYPFQIVEAVPTEAHDFKVDTVVYHDL